MIDPITALAKPAANLTVVLLEPLIRKLQRGISNASQDAYHRIFNSYREYLINAFERYSYFTSIVFKNEQKKLEDYYLPLTLLKHPGNEETTVTAFPRELFSTVKKVLIVDSAGMGKTTLLKYLFLCCVKEVAGIPIYIELRKLSKDQSLLSFIHEQLADLPHLEETNRSHLVQKLLNSGEFVLFLDGYDEIPEDQRAVVTDGLQSFIQKAPLNKFLMTSREEIGLTAFPQFQRFTIRPLQRKEAYTLLKKYAEHNLSATLIDKLEQPENAAIHEFLTNPLLTSLLYKSFEFKHVIPLKRHIFYRQVFEALYETHDLTKEGGEYQRKKKSGMDIDKFDQILRSLGILTYKKDKIEFEKDELLTFIDNAKKVSSDTYATPSSILHDLTHAVPLMVEDGNYIRWTHKSIQEYFAAQYICRNAGAKHKKILLDYLRSKDFTKHVNLVILCADIDRTAFKHSIAKELAEELLAQYHLAYCGAFPEISEDVIERRKRLVVGRSLFLTHLDFPTDVDTSPSSNVNYDRDYERYFAPIHSQMNLLASILGLDLDYGSKFTWTDIGVGEILNKVSSVVEPLHGTELPFIELISTFSKNPEDCLYRIRKTINKLSLAQLINDEPTDPLNQQNIFDDINTLLEIYAGWQFNPDKARMLLEEIENETKAQEDLMDILDF